MDNMAKVDCIFCSIISNKIPSDKIFEDERTLAILDRNPISKGHTLLIPKVHCGRVENLSSEEGTSIFSTLIRIIAPILRVVNADASTIGINDGVDAGQVVPHVHLHIIPRFKDDGGGSLHSVMNKAYIYKSVELGVIAEIIRNNI